MKYYIFFLISSFFFFNCKSQLLISNTTVVDVENKKFLKGYSVLIEKGMITSVAKSINPPQSVQVIDGTGKYLMPGFVDAHVHFFQSGGMFARPDAILNDDEPFYEMKTVADARKYVQQQLPYHPDFIKIWYIVQGANKDSAAKKTYKVSKTL